MHIHRFKKELMDKQVLIPDHYYCTTCGAKKYKTTNEAIGFKSKNKIDYYWRVLNNHFKFIFKEKPIIDLDDDVTRFYQGVDTVKYYADKSNNTQKVV